MGPSFFSIFALCAAQAAFAAVTLTPLPIGQKFADAAAPEAFRFACAATQSELAAFFGEKHLPFEPGMVRGSASRPCHLYYEPTLPGFRALPDNAPVSELFLDLLLPGFLSLRSERYGDPLDIARQLLPLVPRPIHVILGMPQNQERRFYDQALQFHFPSAEHTFGFRENQWDQKNPWVQDYLKSGSAGGQLKILVTRLAFEGRPENGPVMKPMLDSIREERFVRSKLSWDGGDLQFVRSPRNPARLLLVYGKSARKYWGEMLSEAEFAYTLKVEFGADDAADFTDVTSHVDYFVSFLAEDNIALVSQPERENFDIARAAAEVLAQHFRAEPHWEIDELQRLLAVRDEAFGPNLPRIHAALDAIRDRSSSWSAPMDPAIEQRIDAYAEASCKGRPTDCATPASIAKLLATDRSLLRDWSRSAIGALSSEVLAPRIAAIVESQLPDFKSSVQHIVDGNVRELQQLGFRVIRVPRLAGDPVLKPKWPGISYVNATLVDHTLFMPEFGLGKAEWALFDRIRARIPAKYRVVPIYARHVLLYNGGIHCVSGLIRSPEASGASPATAE
ncbi:MAG: agmatine deiminase family protein [Acidobacteriota bacterium]